MPEKSDKCKKVLPAKVCDAVRKEVKQVLKDHGYKIPGTEIVIGGFITHDSKNRPIVGPTLSIRFGKKK
jgi:hypothetical protein